MVARIAVQLRAAPPCLNMQLLLDEIVAALPPLGLTALRAEARRAPHHAPGGEYTAREAVVLPVHGHPCAHRRRRVTNQSSGAAGGRIKAGVIVRVGFCTVAAVAAWAEQRLGGRGAVREGSVAPRESVVHPARRSRSNGRIEAPRGAPIPPGAARFGQCASNCHAGERAVNARERRGGQRGFEPPRGFEPHRRTCD